MLGRMEGNAPVQGGRAYYASSMQSPPAAKAATAAAAAAARQGHITSLAVLPEFRRLGWCLFALDLRSVAAIVVGIS